MQYIPYEGHCENEAGHHLLQAGANAPRHESRERTEIILNTGFLQCRHVSGSIIDTNHRPGVLPAGRPRR